LDLEIAEIKEARGYGYYEAYNPLTSIADRARPLVCRERQTTGITCGSVPPDLEPLLPIVQTILTETEQFARAVLQDRHARRDLFMTAVNGQPDNYFAIDQACRLGAPVVNIGEARLWQEDNADSANAWVQELALLPFEVPDQLPPGVHEDLLQDIEDMELELSDVQMAQVIREMAETYSDSYKQTFLLNGSNIAVRGDQALSLQRCYAE
jgi:hypothetical protein